MYYLTKSLHQFCALASFALFSRGIRPHRIGGAEPRPARFFRPVIQDEFDYHQALRERASEMKGRGDGLCVLDRRLCPDSAESTSTRRIM
jgi:hypothetical protein